MWIVGGVFHFAVGVALGSGLILGMVLAAALFVVLWRDAHPQKWHPTKGSLK